MACPTRTTVRAGGLPGPERYSRPDSVAARRRRRLVRPSGLLAAILSDRLSRHVASPAPAPNRAGAGEAFSRARQPPERRVSVEEEVPHGRVLRVSADGALHLPLVLPADALGDGRLVDEGQAIVGRCLTDLPGDRVHLEAERVHLLAVALARADGVCGDDEAAPVAAGGLGRGLRCPRGGLPGGGGPLLDRRPLRGRCVLLGGRVHGPGRGECPGRRRWGPTGQAAETHEDEDGDEDDEPHLLVERLRAAHRRGGRRHGRPLGLVLLSHGRHGRLGGVHGGFLSAACGRGFHAPPLA
uniref:Uncharacterized protein n=1 Tax=Siphoviridae sp. ctz7e2 TaxID=2826526 RepID=A0A8S5M3I3_9CAUD|nr:MAG TPA: hypothetical protein [Siphoviridae sp. ctz7e2]